MKNFLSGLLVAVVLIGLVIGLGSAQTQQQTCSVFVINTSQYAADIWIHSDELNNTQNLGVLEAQRHMDITGPCTSQVIAIAAFSADPNAPQQFFEVSFVAEGRALHPHSFVILQDAQAPSVSAWNNTTRL